MNSAILMPTDCVAAATPPNARRSGHKAA